jgi:hypothetical protein
MTKIVEVLKMLLVCAESAYFSNQFMINFDFHNG